MATDASAHAKKNLIGWEQLPDPPTFIPDGVSIQINSNEFLLASTWIPNSNKVTVTKPGIYIVNVNTKQWRLWMEYPKDWMEVWGQELVFDEKRNILYLWHKTELYKPGRFEKIYIDTKESETIHDPAVQSVVIEEQAINVQDEIHFIGGWKSNRHIKFDKNNEKFQEIHKFHSYWKMYGTLIVYIESKGVLLAFGGYTGNAQVIGIMEYCLKTKKWRSIENIKYPYYNGHALLTMNERHVILAPTFDQNNGDENVDGLLLILDILDDGGYELRESAVSSPCDATSADDMILMGIADEKRIQLLTFGFVKKLLKDEDVTIPSDDIINLIAKFYDAEMLHVVKWNAEKHVNEHWMIHVSYVVA